MLRPITATLVLAALAAALECAVPSRALGQESLRRLLGDSRVDELWIYDDWEKACATAARERKPIFAVFRCVP